MSTSFNRAYEGFRRRLTPDLSNKFEYATADELKDAIEEIQNAQAQRNGLRNLNKIKHFLHGLDQYAGVLEVFMQVKPDILGLIWVFHIRLSLFSQVSRSLLLQGPIKFCLHVRPLSLPTIP